MNRKGFLRHAWVRLYRLRVLVYVLVALAAVDLVVRGHADLWRRYEPVYYRDRIEAACGQPLDAVFVGASPVMCGVETDVLGGFCCRGERCARVFNLGLPLATMPDIFHAVERVLASKPRVIVYGIVPSDLNSNRRVPEGVYHLIQASAVPRAAQYFPRRAPWLIKHYLNGNLHECWSLYGHREGIRRWLADQLEPICPGLWSDLVQEARGGLETFEYLCTPRGLPLCFPVPPDMRYAHKKATGQRVESFPFLDRFELTGYLPYLEALIELCAREGVILVVVRVPGTADLENGHCPDQYARFDRFLTEFAAQRGLTLLTPTREQIGLGDDDFMDLIHLNADGAAKFSKWLHVALEQL